MIPNPVPVSCGDSPEGQGGGTLAEPKMEAVCSSFSSSSLRGWMMSVMWHVLSVANLRKAPMMKSWAASLRGGQ